MKYVKILVTLGLFIASIFGATAEVAQYKLQVGDFSSLTVTDGINVVYNCSQDSAGWAYFDCEPTIAQRLIFTSGKNNLRVQVSTDGEIITDLPTIYVYSTTLHSVENSGDSTITVERTLPVNEFKAIVIGNGMLVVDNVKADKVNAAIRTGNGHVVISGETREATLKNVGKGVLEASHLYAERVKCSIVGTGPIDCNVSASLTVSGAGSGKVYYGGTPSEIKNRSIGVKAIGIDTKQIID